MTGEKLCSDQTIQQQVVARAVAVSECWSQAAKQVQVPETALVVDWYDAQAEEVLVRSDAIQVKQQKPQRHRRSQPESEAKKPERVRVNTDVWLVERAGGGFRFDGWDQ